MIRSKRRPGVDDPPAISAATALAYELSGSWPADHSRNRFWSGLAIPRHLRFPPDPRPVLGDGTGDYESACRAKADYQARFAAWQGSRIDWLRARANG